MTVLLTRSDVDRAVDVDEVLEVLAEGFRAPAPAQPPLRVRTELPGPGTATCLMPGLLPGVPAYTVKVNAKFPAASPALRGVVCLHDLETGELLALADSAAVTAWRTGLAAALGTHLLADPDAGTLGFVGAGAQARVVAAGLRRLRAWREVVATDLDPGRAAALGALPLESASAVALAADVVVLATWSRRPLLRADEVRPRQHLTTLGADEPGKVELPADLLLASRVVVDDRALAAASGALGNVGLEAGVAAGTLGDVLRGDLPGRDGTDLPTVYAPVGLPWQDLALLWTVYRRVSRAEATIIDLLG
ncbi:ornithine cyclodeaminase family protein [Catellatospora coxensis]|uniref:Ornithine cyclodeaminase n=1 Tax=Catellatospora coxensis TaxID=310354 RepID=A0A8J3KZG4_9ACTN|nr:ornithine cyclodeaminase family protein [Catellatospora coxensis]GIG09142.1 ornithine cyclodeaminase [Catellatospora coxensis]